MTHLPPGAVEAGGTIIDKATGEAYLNLDAIAAHLGLGRRTLNIWSHRWRPGSAVPWPGHNPDQCARKRKGRRQLLRISTVRSWMADRDRHIAAVNAANAALGRASQARKRAS